MNLFKSLLLLISLSFASAALAQDTHPFSAEDLVRLNRLSDPQISPDGRYVAYVLRETDMAANKGYSDIWLLDLQNPIAVPKRLTTNEENDASPRWSADGTALYFLSGRLESSQIWMLPLAGGEARQVSDFPVDVTTFALSPDNQSVAFTAAVFPDCRTLKCSANRLQLKEDSPENGIVYDQLIIRFWDQWRTGVKSQLFLAELTQAGVIEGEPFNAAKALVAEIPAYPNIGAGAYTFGAESKYLYFSTKLQDQEESWSVNSDLYRVRVDGKRGPEKLTRDNPAQDDNPVISADGKWLAWLATEGPERWAADYKIKLMNLKTGKVTTLGGGWDRSPGTIVFARGGGAILALSDHLGARVLWAVPLDGTAPDMLAGAGWISAVADSAAGPVFARSDLQHPADLYLLGGGRVRQLTAVNADLLAGVGMGAYEQFSFTGAHGDTVYGYVVNPPDYSKKRKYPVTLIIHGGPHGSYGNSFSYRSNPQVYAGAGYGAVFIDFHGSTGYGQAFVEAIHGDRGGATLEDNQLGLAAALAKYPWLDGGRVCALGASFGGYMMNIIEGAWPERFKCLVNHDGMFDNRMKYYSGDIIGYLEEGFGGAPYFEDPASHELFNPVNDVARWQTPMLVIHGEKDYRVPITQSIGAFTALQRRGIESRFLYFPDENHWVLSPANSLQWYNEVLRWLDRWLKR